MTFKPFHCPDRWKGLLSILGLLLFDALLARIVLTRPLDGASFVLGLFVLASVPVIGYLMLRTAGAFNLEYWVDRDGVTVVWGTTRQILPMGDIERIQRGAVARAEQQPRPWHWPCPECRLVDSETQGVVRSYATRPLAEQLILVTPGGSFGISPTDPEAFLDALQERYRLGVARRLKAEERRSPLWTWPLWRDWKAIALIGAGLLGVVILFGVLAFRFPSLSSDLPLHFDINGLPDRIAPKSGLLALPLIGFAAWAANLAGGVWIYRRVQRQGAYLLWAGAVAVQIIAGLALRNIVRW
ncbi:MAG TPA: PH domain-containing protein [Anaerolineae bacterium]